MNIIGIYELKTHASEIVERAAKGEKIRVTKNGRRMVMIVPDIDAEEFNAKECMEQIRELRKGVKGPILKKGETWRQLAHKGHRY